MEGYAAAGTSRGPISNMAEKKPEKAAGGELNLSTLVEGFWETEHRGAGATLVSVLIMILWVNYSSNRSPWRRAKTPPSVCCLGQRNCRLGLMERGGGEALAVVFI